MRAVMTQLNIGSASPDKPDTAEVKYGEPSYRFADLSGNLPLRIATNGIRMVRNK